MCTTILKKTHNKPVCELFDFLMQRLGSLFWENGDNCIWTTIKKAIKKFFWSMGPHWNRGKQNNFYQAKLWEMTGK